MPTIDSDLQHQLLQKTSSIESKLEDIIRNQNETSRKIDKLFDETGYLSKSVAVLEAEYKILENLVGKNCIAIVGYSERLLSVENDLVKVNKGWEKVADLVFKVAGALLLAYISYKLGYKD